MPGIFRVTPFPDGDPNPREFYYEQIPGATEPPLKDALAFRDEVERANTTIKNLLSHWDADYYTKPTYRKYYLSLLRAAEAGLKPDGANIVVGRNALQGVKDGFILENGVEIRARSIRSTSYVLGIVIAVALLAGVGSHLYLSSFDSLRRTGDFYQLLMLCDSGFFILLGISISMWVSAILRNQTISWNSIAFFDPAQFPPILRLALICGLAFALCVMLLVKWITLGVGPETLNEFPGRPLLSIIIGLFCGLAEDRVSKLVISRFSELPGNRGKKDPQ